MSPTQAPDPRPAPQRSGPPTGSAKALLAVAMGLAVVGFFVGTGSAPHGETPLVLHDSLPDEAGTRVMPTYREARTRAAGAGMDWSGELAALQGPSPTDPVDLEGTSKTADLAARSARRAYDGAPPTVPHPVRQSAAAECLACHETGMRLQDKVARPMSHPTYASCTQCHVVSTAPMPGAPLPPDATFAENTFMGQASPVAGARAWSIAPPEIPHKRFMREQCSSCHGPNGRDALRSTHPERQQCEQCHAPSSILEQRPVSLAQP